MEMEYKMEHAEDFWKCAQCGFCTAECPVAKEKGWESFTPRGKMQILKLLSQKKIELSNEIKERFYSCTTCSRCSKSCQVGLDLVGIWEEARAALVKEKIGPMPVHKKIAMAIEDHHNSFGDNPQQRLQWMKGLQVERKGEVAFFAGCTAALKNKDLARNSVRILQAMGKKVAVLGEDEWCCGSVLLRTGQREQMERIVRHNVESLKATGAKVVVTACTGCFKTLSTDYTEF